MVRNFREQIVTDANFLKYIIFSSTKYNNEILHLVQTNIDVRP